LSGGQRRLSTSGVFTGQTAVEPLERGSMRSLPELIVCYMVSSGGYPGVRRANRTDQMWLGRNQGHTPDPGQVGELIEYG